MTDEVINKFRGDRLVAFSSGVSLFV